MLQHLAEAAVPHGRAAFSVRTYTRSLVEVAVHFRKPSCLCYSGPQVQSGRLQHLKLLQDARLCCSFAPWILSRILVPSASFDRVLSLRAVMVSMSFATAGATLTYLGAFCTRGLMQVSCERALASLPSGTVKHSGKPKANRTTA